MKFHDDANKGCGWGVVDLKWRSFGKSERRVGKLKTMIVILGIPFFLILLKAPSYKTPPISINYELEFPHHYK
jgi:hypothetical protein